MKPKIKRTLLLFFIGIYFIPSAHSQSSSSKSYENDPLYKMVYDSEIPISRLPDGIITEQLTNYWVQSGMCNRGHKRILAYVQYTGNKYNRYIKADEIAKRLNLPIETLYKYALLGYYEDFLYNPSKYNDIEFTKHLYKLFFNPPYPSSVELMNKDYTFKDETGTLVTKRFNSSNSYLLDLYIPCKTESEMEKGSRRILANELEVESKVTSANNLKTYAGTYTLSGFGMGENGLVKREGTAKYTYIEKTDGSRIYEGKFNFSNGNNVRATGYFKNNKQIGLWVWDAPARNYGTFHCEINFNENGKPDGDFSMIVKDDYHHGYATRSRISGTFENGDLIKLHCTDYPIRICQGKYKNDKPVGTWQVEVKGEHSIEMEFDQNGIFVKGGYRDTRTGDWIKGYSELPKTLIRDVYGYMRGFCYRSTSF